LLNRTNLNELPDPQIACESSVDRLIGSHEWGYL